MTEEPTTRGGLLSGVLPPGPGTTYAVNTEHNELTLEEAWVKRMEYNRQHKMLPKTQLQIKACRHGHIDSLFGVHTVGPHTADMQYAGSTLD